VKDSKIALTMKPDGLGKAEWVSSEGKGKRREEGRRGKGGGSGRGGRR